ncbi:MAG: AMP-binding protein [Proteobacteria bacterium]|nr:AMP-binding protein [Pseudomonadota bacterium]
MLLNFGGPTVDEAAIIKSFDTLVDRHESLRTTFSFKSGIPYQVIHSKSDCGFQVEIADVSKISDDEIRKRAYEIAQQPFDLSKAPLLKVILLRHRRDRYFLLFCSHHIIMDGRSFNVMIIEFSKLYTIYHRNESASDWVNLRIQYADFSVWQRNRLEEGLRQRQLAYWAKQLANLSPLDFPTDFMRSENIGATGKRIPFHFDKSLLDKLRILSHRAKTTLFTTVLTAYAVLLNKYTEKTDIVIGTPIAGRQYPGVENMIGHFINILILRLDLSENPDFLTLLVRNHHTVLEAYTHQDLPFEELVKQLNPNRQITENPLTQMMLVFQESDHEIIKIPDIKLTKVFSDNDQLLLLADYDHAKLDMTIHIQVMPEGLEGLIEYNSCLYSQKTIAGIIRHFHNILLAIGDDPGHPCSTISMLDQDEYQKLLFEWNQTMNHYPCQTIVTHLFEQQAQAQPDHVAIIFYDQQITYRLLNQKANQLAYYLQTKNVRAQMLVAVYLNRSIDLAIAILAVFKIGAVYVPISPDLPKEHSRYLIEDSHAGVILTHQSLLDQANNWFNQYPFLNILLIDRLESLEYTEQNNRMDVNLISRVTPHYIAAMIYTSGSTGKPKGVLIRHQGLVNTTCAQIQYLNITPRSRIMQVASMNFDAALWDILGALVSGATLCLVNQEDILNTYRFVELLQEQHISLMTVTPSYLSALPKADLPELQTLVVAGEPCPISLVKYWAKNRQFVNAYGPTETTICATMAT